MQYVIQNMKMLKNNSMNKPHYRGEIVRYSGALLALARSWEPAYDPRNIEFLLQGEVSLFIMDDHE